METTSVAPLSVTPLYLALLCLLWILFTMRAGFYRAKKEINLGDGGDPELLRRIRGHGNFIESVPLAWQCTGRGAHVFLSDALRSSPRRVARIHWPRRRVPVRDQAGRVGGWCESCQARHIQKRSGIFGCQFFFELLKLALSMLESVEVRLETLATRLILLRQQFPALLLLPGYPLLRHRIPGLCHLESGRYPSR